MVLLLLLILGNACWRLRDGDCPHLLLSLMMSAVGEMPQAFLRRFLQVVLELKCGARLLLWLLLLLKSSSQIVLAVYSGDLGLDRQVSSSLTTFFLLMLNAD